jgi:hypothetical protein
MASPCKHQLVESLERFLSDPVRSRAAVPPAGDTLVTEEQPASAESRPIKRRPRIKHEISFRDRLLKTAHDSREQAATLPPGAERDRLLLKAQQCETALGIEKWVSMPRSDRPDELDNAALKLKR